MIHYMTELDELPAPFFTVQQLATRWGISERAVQKWIKRGVFPNAYRIGIGRGSHYRVPKPDVFDFERRRKVQP